MKLVIKPMLKRDLIIMISIVTVVVTGVTFANEGLSQERKTELANLLEQDCGSCHGSLLNGSLGPSLLPDALQGKSAEFIKKTILDGRPNTAMPPWRPLLSEADADWLVAELLQTNANKNLKQSKKQ